MSSKSKFLRTLVPLGALCAFLAIPGSAMAWTPAATYTLASPAGVANQLRATLTGGATVQSDASFTAPLAAGVLNPGTVTAATFNNTTSTAATCATVAANSVASWKVSGVNTGSGSGPVTILPSFTVSLFSNAACTTLAGTLTVNGALTQSVNGAYTASTGVLNFTGGTSTLRVTAASGTAAALLGAAVTLDRTVAIPSGTIPALQ